MLIESNVHQDGAMLLDKDVIRDVFYNRCDPKDIDEAADLLGSFPSGPLTVPVTYTAYREIPSTYIVCENDKALPLSYQERMIAQGDGTFHVERCQEGHAPFLSNPSFVVDCIRRAAGESL
jgi:pimeloyl-ACP methyl ester carboxylesterase